ncbi:uncharacterized protein A4U43_C07F5610 [Asparagus officinalis]|uniref:Uncharacterized protein n=1 Tax=Asparagus officinalis TaxID=4686 RepID=A0A5P1E9Q8_ASPOF|nr:uncharacterized protein A4U43_C07F5610 [Asparagus officinalis]
MVVQLLLESEGLAVWSDECFWLEGIGTAFTKLCRLGVIMAVKLKQPMRKEQNVAGINMRRNHLWPFDWLKKQLFEKPEPEQ